MHIGEVARVVIQRGTGLASTVTRERSEVTDLAGVSRTGKNDSRRRRAVQCKLRVSPPQCATAVHVP